MQVNSYRLKRGQVFLLTYRKATVKNLILDPSLISGCLLESQKLKAALSLLVLIQGTLRKPVTDELRSFDTL